jgi:hypothetical protein
MAQITSVEEFKTFILQELGHPVITVELADVHLQQSLDEAIYDFSRYNYSEGNFKDFLIVNLSANQAVYDLSGSGVNDVVDIILSTGGSGNINTLFTPVNMILSPMDFVKLGNFQIVDYHVAMMKLSEIVDYFTITYKADYNQSTQKLRLTPTPPEDSQIMIEVYKKESAINLYNNQLVKKLAVARAMIIWGRILRKYSITLPGGGTLNGTDILADGKEMLEETLTLIKGESEPPSFFVA